VVIICGTLGVGRRRKKVLQIVKRFHKEEAGQDLIEYALIGLIVALGAIAGMGTLASSINSVYTQIASQLS
jgi:Flp pilus assembly pilin Flp